MTGFDMVVLVFRRGEDPDEFQIKEWMSTGLPDVQLHVGPHVTMVSRTASPHLDAFFVIACFTRGGTFVLCRDYGRMH